MVEAGVAPSGSKETASGLQDAVSVAAATPPPALVQEEPLLEPSEPAVPTASIPVPPLPLDLSTRPPSSSVETTELVPVLPEVANELPTGPFSVQDPEVDPVNPDSVPSPMEAPAGPIAKDQPPPLAMPGVPNSSSGSPDPPSPTPSDSFAADFWKLAKENPSEVLDRFQLLLSSAREKNDLPLIERAYCVMAVVYAIRGDEPRAMERLGQARVVAMRRGDTADVEHAEERVRMLLSE